MRNYLPIKTEKTYRRRDSSRRIRNTSKEASIAGYDLKLGMEITLKKWTRNELGELSH